MSAKSPKSRKLTQLRQNFCREYIKNDGRQDVAYLKAGFKCTDPIIASKEAYKLLKLPEIQREIERIRQELRQEELVTLRYVIEGLKNITDANIKNYIDFTEDGIVLKNLQDLDEVATKAINKITYRKAKDGSVSWSVQLYDRLSALVKLGEYIGAFSDLNQASAIFLKYGYTIKEIPGGYLITDSMQELPSATDSDEFL